GGGRRCAGGGGRPGGAATGAAASPVCSHRRLRRRLARTAPDVQLPVRAGVALPQLLRELPGPQGGADDAPEPAGAVRAHRPHYWAWTGAAGHRRREADVMLTVALKEWAVVCDLLLEGKCSLLLRKGGVHEDRGPGRFELEHERFTLYPAWEH